MNKDLWREKTIIGTCHTACKEARRLAPRLNSCGAKVTGIASDLPNTASFCKRAGVHRTLSSTFGGIRGTVSGAIALDMAKPETVLRLAAYPFIRRPYVVPFEAYMANVIIASLVMQNARRARSVRNVPVVTGGKCYEKSKWEVDCGENDAMGGVHPDNNCNGYEELVTSSFRRSFCATSKPDGRLCGFVSARAHSHVGNNYLTAGRLIPPAASTFASKRPVSIRNPAAAHSRPHVLEPLAAVCCRPKNYGKTWPNMSATGASARSKVTPCSCATWSISSLPYCVTDRRVATNWTTRRRTRPIDCGAISRRRARIRDSVRAGCSPTERRPLVVGIATIWVTQTSGINCLTKLINSIVQVS